MTTAAAAGYECHRCETEIEGEPIFDELGRAWCSEDCQINAAEQAHERMLAQFYGGATWP